MFKLVALLMMVHSVAPADVIRAGAAKRNDTVNWLDSCWNYKSAFLQGASDDHNDQTFVFEAEECRHFCLVKGEKCKHFHVKIDYDGQHQGELKSECTLVMDEKAKSGKGGLNDGYISGPAKCEEKSYHDDACVLWDYRRETNWPIKKGEATHENVTSYVVCLQKCRDNFANGCVHYTLTDGTCVLLRAGEIVFEIGSVTGKGHCDECMDVGADYWGFDLHSGDSKRVKYSLRDCQQYCDSLHDCSGVVYALAPTERTPTGTCFPKYGMGKRMPNARFITAEKNCKRDPLNPCWNFGVYFVGKPVGYKVENVVSAMECRETCQNRDGCNFVNYVLGNVKTGEKDAPHGAHIGDCYLLADKGEIKTEGFAEVFMSGEVNCSRNGIFQENQSTYTHVKFVIWGLATTEKVHAVTLEICQEECNGHKYCSNFNYKDPVDMEDLNCHMLSDAKLVEAANEGYTVGWKVFKIEAFSKLNVGPPCEMKHAMILSVGFKILQRKSFALCWKMCDDEDKCGSVNYSEDTGDCALLSDRFGKSVPAKKVISGNKCG